MKSLGSPQMTRTKWMQQPGPTVFMPFPLDTDHFPTSKQWMINFRVADLDQLISALRDAEIAVTTNLDWDTPETGRFAVSTIRRATPWNCGSHRLRT